MKIELHEVCIRDVVEGYKNSDEEGVVGYKGLLNIRPKYQREYIYKDKQRDAVINTVKKGFPLNTMYWAKNQDGTFEVLDGQQRILSLCKFIKGDFSIEIDNEIKYFHTLVDVEKEQIYNYKLMVYFCEGDDKEKLDWFKTINIAGVKLTDQELLNATYTGPWLTDAKRYFSKSNCAAYNIAKDYLNGSAIRQEYLETELKWISNDNIQQYMADHQHDPTSNEMWLHFQSVIHWVEVTFKYRKEMKGVNFGKLYEQFKDKMLDPKAIEDEVTKLMKDEDVTSKSGIYEYVLTRNERALSIRAFTDNMKREAYERQDGVCPKCKGKFELNDMEADHITPWSQGGRTVAGNCQMLCKRDNRLKSGI